MAEDKKSFLLYCDLIHTVNKMPDEKAGVLFKHILSYVNDLNPDTEDLIVSLTFEPIKQSLKRDLRKYEKTLEERSFSGRIGNLKRWNIDLYNQFSQEKITLEQAEKIANNRKVSHSDKNIAKVAVSDSVNVSDSVSDILLEKETKVNNLDFDFNQFWSLYPKKVEKAKCEVIYNRLSKNDKQKIKESLSGFISFKPFPDYNHPNPKTYLNGKRWNDEIKQTKSNLTGSSWRDEDGVTHYK